MGGDEAAVVEVEVSRRASSRPGRPCRADGEGGVKTWKAWMVWSTRLKKITGESIGTVMERN